MNTKYSSFWSRVGATIVDIIVLAVPTQPLLWLAYGKGYYTSAELIQGPLDFVLTWILPAIYYIGMWVMFQATLGKKALGQIIVDSDTLEPASIGQLIGRYLAYIPYVLCFGLGLIWVALDKRNQGWHDKLAGTLVIEK